MHIQEEKPAVQSDRVPVKPPAQGEGKAASTNNPGPRTPPLRCPKYAMANRAPTKHKRNGRKKKVCTMHVCHKMYVKPVASHISANYLSRISGVMSDMRMYRPHKRISQVLEKHY